jgi:hypothetical protein
MLRIDTPLSPGALPSTEIVGRAPSSCINEISPIPGIKVSADAPDETAVCI